MTKEESVKRADEAIHGMEMAILDIKEMKQWFIDFDDNMEGVGPIDHIGDRDGMALGMIQPFENSDKMFNITFYSKYDLYTKTIYTTNEELWKYIKKVD